MNKYFTSTGAFYIKFLKFSRLKTFNVEKKTMLNKIQNKISLINSILWRKSENHNYKGKYIVIEGICGSGKDTQCQLLADELNLLGYKAIKVQEAGVLFHSIIKSINSDSLRFELLNDQDIRRHIHIADRYHFVKTILKPSLEKYDFVISSRSFISTLVYQCKSASERTFIQFIQDFVPTPNLAILLDNDFNTSMKRIEHRDKITNSSFHNKVELIYHRQNFLELFETRLAYSQFIINSSSSIDLVQKEIFKKVKQLFRIKEEK